MIYCDARHLNKEGECDSVGSLLGQSRRHDRSDCIITKIDLMSASYFFVTHMHRHHRG